jgi:hypothetical protein
VDGMVMCVVQDGVLRIQIFHHHTLVRTSHDFHGLVERADEFFQMLQLLLSLLLYSIFDALPMDRCRDQGLKAVKKDQLHLLLGGQLDGKAQTRFGVGREISGDEYFFHDDEL